MGSSKISRNVNILYEFNSASQDDIIEIYRPGFLNPYDIVTGLKYSGFITSLRLTIDISSITELSIVSGDILDDDPTINANNKDTFINNPKKCISFFMGLTDKPLVKVADIFLFNQRPYYYLDLISYFTSSSTFDLASDAVLACEIRDVGYGRLLGNDRVTLLGCVIEEAPNHYPEYLEIDL